MIRVRAKQDGTYGGYVWYGPRESDQGTTPGDVFDIDEKPFVLKDEQGRPIQEMEPTGQVDAEGKKLFRLAWVMENGKIKKDSSGQPIPKLKMTTFFSNEWMERVADDTELTYEDRIVPFPTLEAYRIKKSKATKTVALPADVAEAAAVASNPRPESVI